VSVGGAVLVLIGLYAIVGLGVAVAFVLAGAALVLPQKMEFTFGARLLLIPGSAALWPYVLRRWLKARSAA
jgi:hypothetical protein